MRAGFNLVVFHLVLPAHTGFSSKLGPSSLRAKRRRELCDDADNLIGKGKNCATVTPASVRARGSRNAPFTCGIQRLMSLLKGSNRAPPAVAPSSGYLE